MGLKNVVVCTLFFWLTLLGSGCDRELSQMTGEKDKKNKAQEVIATEGDTTLRFYNWEDYTGSQTIGKFKKATGIDLHLETFEDEETVLGALQSGAISADIIVVSQSLAQEMRKAKLLQPIDYSRLSNSKHFKKGYVPDPDSQGNRYWVPYLWGTTGLVVNTNHITGDYKTWSVLWDPRYSGKIAMLNNGFEVAASAAKRLGYSVNPTVEQLEEISRDLLEQKQLLKGYFSSTEIIAMMRDETLWAAQIYNGDGLTVAEEFDFIEFVSPREGTAMWCDVFVIPRKAANSEKAHIFIDFIHTPEILASIADEYWFASTNSTAEQYMSAEVLQAEEVYPPDEVLEKSEFFQDMGSGESVRKRVRIWAGLTNN